MAFNRLFTVLGATAIGLTMASSAMAGYMPVDIEGPTVNVGVPSTANGLGFGKFLGTWIKEAAVVSPNTPSAAMPNTNPSGNNADEVGNAILGQYSGLFNINEFNWAGAADGFTPYANLSDSGKGFRVEEVIGFKEGESITAKWNYYGLDEVMFPDSWDDPVDLFVSVKYSNNISFFRYEGVKPGDFGYLTSDFQVILNETPADALKPGSLTVLLRDDLNYNGLDDNFSNGKNMCTVLGNFSNTCMPYNESSKNPIGISHVTAYWPPLDGEEVPEPASMTLLGAGLLGLGWLNRRRKAA